MTPRHLLPAALLVLLPTACLAEQRPAPPADVVREHFLEVLNEERGRRGLPPLRLDGRISEVAQEHAAELARRGSIELPRGTAEALGERLERAGYQAQEWTEQVSLNSYGPGAVIDGWKRQGAWQAALREEVRDLGIGVDRLDGTPLYVFVLAVPRGEHFARATAGLEDLARVRRQVLDLVNEERKRAGLRPLRASKTLDASSQRHAEDMLTRAYFAHASPEGTTVRRRVEAAGYAPRAVAENLAAGPTTAAQVVEGWMNSPGHRANILDPDYTELGVGLAIGENRKGHQVLWVQNFGRPR